MKARRAIVLLLGAALLGSSGWIVWDQPRVSAPLREVDWLFDFEIKHPQVVIPHFEIPEVSIEEAVAVLNRHVRNLLPPPHKLQYVVWKESDPIPPGMQPTPRAPARGIAADSSAEAAIPTLEPFPSTIPSSSEQPRLSLVGPLSLQNSSLSEAAGYISNLAGLKCILAGDFVWLYSEDRIQQVPVTKEFYLMGQFRALVDPQLAESPEGEKSERINIERWLTSNGVAFRPGEYAYYEPSSERLVVHLPWEQIDLIETITASSCRPFMVSSRWERLKLRAQYRWYDLKETFWPTLPLPASSYVLPLPSETATIPGLDAPEAASPAQSAEISDRGSASTLAPARP